MKIGPAIDTRRCLASQTFEEAFGRIQAGGGGGVERKQHYSCFKQRMETLLATSLMDGGERGAGNKLQLIAFRLGTEG